MAVYRANHTQHEYTVWPDHSAGGAIHTVWPVQSAGGVKHTLCGQFRVQVVLYTHCVARSEGKWCYTHTVWPVQSAGGAMHTVWPVQSAVGAKHTLCGQFRVL